MLAIRGTPSKPTVGEDESVIESYSHPHLLLDSALRAELEDDDYVAADVPVCLHPDRKLPSLRITKQDLDKYGFTEGCPRCENTKMGDTITNSNHWESCRRRIYRSMYASDDPKLHRWLRDHPTDDTKVGRTIYSESGGATSSTAPAPSASGASTSTAPPLPPPSGPPGDLHVFEGAEESEFS